MHHKLGHRVLVSVRVTPLRDELNNITGAVEIFTLKSKTVDLIQEMEQLRKEVLTDCLTGVGNRRYAEIAMYNLDMTMQEIKTSFGVLFIDIDYFKNVNDTFGHDAGDQILDHGGEYFKGRPATIRYTLSLGRLKSLLFLCQTALLTQC